MHGSDQEFTRYRHGAVVVIVVVVDGDNGWLGADRAAIATAAAALILVVSEQSCG
jgi:hypothetical protein